MFYVDDRFHTSDPVLRIPREHRAAAVGLWTLAGTWSRHFLKDGFVPGHMIEELGSSTEVAALLVDVKLWRKKGAGYLFNDWSKWQDTREKVEKKREAWRERQNRSRGSKADSPDNTGDDHEGVTRDLPVSPPHPLPYPDPQEQTDDNGRPTGDPKRQSTGVDNPVDKDGYPAVLAAARKKLEELNGGTIDVGGAGIVVDLILDRGGKRVRNPRHYVLGILRDHGHEWLNYIHTGKVPE